MTVQHARGVCPKCGKPKIRRSVRCAECYAAEMYAAGNAPVSTPIVVSDSDPLAEWHGEGFGQQQPAPIWHRWRLTDWGQWVLADGEA